MFLKLAVLAVAFVAVSATFGGGGGCSFGQSCKCSKDCRGNLYCLRDEKGGLSCQCLPCQYYNFFFKRCDDKPTPDYGECCTDECQSNFQCVAGFGGIKKCTCPPPQQYYPETHSCVTPSDPSPDLGHGEECADQCPDPFVCKDDAAGNKACLCERGWYDADKNICNETCISKADGDSACASLPNGNYPYCEPECACGNFIMCSNGYLHEMECALGWYRPPEGGVEDRFTSKLVYDPTKNACDYKTCACPRRLDRFVET